MSTVLVGSTGFVGGNLLASHDFDACYHSTDISESFGTCPDLVVYAGVTAAKYLANRAPQADRAKVRQAYENLKAMRPRKVILISTIDVYKDPCGKDENSPMELDGLHPYGRNRLELEDLVRNEFDTLVVRLPALFGKGLKKNFVYDAMTRIPTMLSEEKYRELSEKMPMIPDCYRPEPNGLYRCIAEGSARDALYKAFCSNDWSALHFTDSRSTFQFYDLSWLWRDLSKGLDLGIGTLNLTSEPVSAAEVYTHCFSGSFRNELPAGPVHYDLRSVHATAFGGCDGYCYSRSQVLDALLTFTKGENR